MSIASPCETSRPRFALRVFALLLSVIGIAVYTSAYHYVAWAYDIIFAVPGLYSLINAILVSVKRPIHPGFHIALDLIFAAVMLFFGISGIVLVGYSEYRYVGYHLRNSAIATLVIMVVNGLIHFVHFVLACCDVHLRRHAGHSSHYTHRKEGVELSQA